MSRDTGIHIKNKKAFEWAFEVWATQSKRSLKAGMQQQARGLTRHLIRVTPPGGGKLSMSGNGWGASAMNKQGTDTVRSQVARVFRKRRTRWKEYEKPGSLEDSMPALRRHHEKHRRRGRVRAGGRRKKMKVSAKAYNTYLQSRLQQVGTLQSGWARAARRLGVKKLPAYIDRHRGPGTYAIIVNESQIRIRVSNRVSFAGNLDVIAKRINWAVGRQARSMKLTAISYALGEAKKAGFEIKGNKVIHEPPKGKKGGKKG